MCISRQGMTWFSQKMKPKMYPTQSHQPDFTHLICKPLSTYIVQDFLFVSHSSQVLIILKTSVGRCEPAMYRDVGVAPGAVDALCWSFNNCRLDGRRGSNACIVLVYTGISCLGDIISVYMLYIAMRKLSSFAILVPRFLFYLDIKLCWS